MREAGRLHEVFTHQTYDVGDDKNGTLIEALEELCNLRNHNEGEEIDGLSDEHDFIDDILRGELEHAWTCDQAAILLARQEIFDKVWFSIFLHW